MARRKQRAGIEVEGGAQLRRAFDRLGDRAGDLRETHGDAAQIVAQEAETLVPRLSGRLGDTIRTSRTRSGSAVLAGGRSLVVYAGPIHFGWRARNIEPQLFLYDALDRRSDEVIERYAHGVDTLIRRFDAEAP